MNIIKKIKNACDSSIKSFENSFSGRNAILNDMRALDEAKEIFSMASVMSNSYNKIIKQGFTSDNISEDDLINLIKKDMLLAPSIFDENMLISFSKMTRTERDAVIGCARMHLDYTPSKDKIHGLAISGAGGKGQFFVGAIKALEDEGVLKNIETFAGTSAGALTAIPLCMGIDSKGLEEIVRNTDFRVFMIEGRAYNTVEKRLKRNMKSGRIKNIEQNTNDIAVSDLINSVKVLIEEEMNLHENRVMFKDGLHSDLELRTVYGDIVNFMGIELKEPIPIEFTEDKFSENINKLWSDPNIREGCSEKIDFMNKAAKTEIFKDPKDLLKISLSFAYKMDYVEFYFGKLIYERIRDFVSKYGEDTLQSIVPNMSNQGCWSNISLKDLGKLARSKEGRDFGFRDLAIGVTKTANKKSSSERTTYVQMGDIFSYRLGQYKTPFQKLIYATDLFFDHSNLFHKYEDFVSSINQIFRTEGIMVSSNPDSFGDDSLAEAPIKEIARMSMSIPFEFNQKLFGDTYFVDGGLHHNLPTKYFDLKSPGGFDRNILSIIPLTASEIEGGKSLKDCFYSPGAFSPSRQTSFSGWNSIKSVEAVLAEIRDHLAGYLAKFIITRNNLAYKEMGIKESYRNIIINTMNYGTMSFSSTEDDFKSLNEDSYRTVVGENLSDGGVQSGIFDSEYNSYVRLLEQKISIYKKEKPEVYQEAKIAYQEIKENMFSEDIKFSKQGIKSIERMFSGLTM